MSWHIAMFISTQGRLFFGHLFFYFDNVGKIWSFLKQLSEKLFSRGTIKGHKFQISKSCETSEYTIVLDGMAKFNPIHKIDFPWSFKFRILSSILLWSCHVSQLLPILFRINSRLILGNAIRCPTLPHLVG